MPKSFFRETGRQAISTLDPRKLRTSDFQDLSGQRRVQIPLVLPGFEPAYAQLYLANTVGGTPRGTHGFLYYDAGGGDAAQGTPGEVRFRVTESSDPASFPHGQDMPKYLSSFEPWSLPLTHIAHIRLHCALRVLLEKDGLVVSWQAVPNPASKRITISALGEPFRVKFGRTPPLTVKGAHSEASCCLVLIRPVPPIPPGVTRHPVVGSALCCFEQSQDANLLVIRVLKIIEPPRYSHPTYEGKISLPVEGDILRGPGGIPRTYPLNRRSKIAGTLRLLVPTQW
ncbi:hypothetical protein PLICRDRAFT_53942 [Plicaturopsis crispa FD-325 SS-3]|nr:hypothetical protein PLICRDRAFT_53942 [Plicaturopsis crispa FD-325 SS-3]